MKIFITTFIIVSLFLSSFSFAGNEKTGLKFTNQVTQISKIRLLITNYTNLPDDSLQKFVGVNHPFSNKTYEPTDLIALQGRSHISAQTRHTLREEAANALEKMANDFYTQFGTNIVVASAYRSYSYQKNSISESCKKSGRCAREGESEHQLGLAVDLREATNEQKFLSKYQKYYERLKANAHLYGFHQSYQNGREFDGYYIEPRHRRYLGVELATKLHQKNITFTQYVNLINAITKHYSI